MVSHSETAFAKINLALHVRQQRDDGYHELETLFAFVDMGDTLVARLSDQDNVLIHGEFGSELNDPFGNLVARALNLLPRSQPLAIELEKNLPIAAGLGGGSADAAAVFRLIEREFGLPKDWKDRAARLGADIPACVSSNTCIGRGTGTELEPITSDLTGKPVLLVNPRVPVPTGLVFAAWDQVDRGALPTGTASDIAINGRNDLEAPAIQICPEIAEVRDALRQTEPWLSRMSGSGATCFAIYDDDAALERAVSHFRRSHANWWIGYGRLRP